MAPPREPVYAKDEKALCFHHEFLYEAKVLDSRLSDANDKKSPLQYRVHYKGWKNTWDDWVPQDRLRKLTEENKQLATNLKREMDEMNPRTTAKSATKKKGKTAGSDLSSARGSEERQSPHPSRGQKRGRDIEIEKVRARISSTPTPPSRQSSRRSVPSKKAIEATETAIAPPEKKARTYKGSPGSTTESPSSSSQGQSLPIKKGRSANPSPSGTTISLSSTSKKTRPSTPSPSENTKSLSPPFAETALSEPSRSETADSPTPPVKKNRLSKPSSDRTTESALSSQQPLSSTKDAQMLPHNMLTESPPLKNAKITLFVNATKEAAPAKKARISTLSAVLDKAPEESSLPMKATVSHLTPCKSPSPSQPSSLPTARKGRRPQKKAAAVVSGTSDSPPVTSDELDRLEAAVEVTLVHGVDNDFWAKEAASLNIAWGPYTVVPPTLSIQSDDTPPAMPIEHKAALKIEIAPSKKQLRPSRRSQPSKDEFVPLCQISDAALARRVAEMQRASLICIGSGAHEPNEPRLGTREYEARKKATAVRHAKYLRTLQFDTANHAKLAFYEQVSTSQNPVIAGFAPDNAPADILEAAQGKQKKKDKDSKRKAKTGHYKVVSSSLDDPAEAPAAKKQRTVRTTITSSEDDQVPIIHLRGGYLCRESVPGIDEGVSKDQGFKTIQWPTMNSPKDNAMTQEDQIAGPGLMEDFLCAEKSDNDTNDEFEQEEHFHARPAVKIEVSDHLKSLLVDDWENVTKNLSLVPVPAEHPVSEILSTYFEEEKGKRRLGSAEADLLEEVVQGTKDYFEKCLGKLLLYRFEREQYFRVYQAMEKGEPDYEGKTISDIYGAEHLSRLFVSLPELIAQTNMDAQSVSKLRQEIQSLTAWLGKNSTRFFTAEYEAAPQEYIEKARGL